ncbi:hypothetical protein [Parasphingopyxis sp.]|nr:hypothetical protein [Parasphingopyxis sp.]
MTILGIIIATVCSTLAAVVIAANLLLRSLGDDPDEYRADDIGEGSSHG